MPHLIETGLEFLSRRQFDRFEKLILDEQQRYEHARELERALERKGDKLGNSLAAAACQLKSVDEATQRWLAQSPESYAAIMARATFLYAKGVAARGSGVADSVSTQGWRVVKESFASAYALYVRAALKVTMPTLACAQIGKIIWISGEDHHRDDCFPGKRNWYDYGLSLDPASLLLRSAKFNLLRPEWGGDFQGAEAYLKSSLHDLLTPRDRVKLLRYGNCALGFYQIVFEDETVRGFARIDAAIASEPNGPWGYYWRGLAHKNNGDAKPAFDDFQRAVEIDCDEDVDLLEEEIHARWLVDTNDPLIESKLMRLVALGQATFFHHLARHRRFNLNDPAGAMEVWRKGADEGILRCMFEIARAYDVGEVVKADPGEALSWYQKTWDAGDWDAASYMYNIVSEGRSTLISKADAVRLLLNAANERDHAWSHYALARAMRYDGLRVDGFGNISFSSEPLAPQTEAARAYIAHLTTASDSEVRYAQTLFAQHYRAGDYVTQSITEAHRLLDTAADAGDASAQTLLAEMIFNGDVKDAGTDSKSRAFSLYKNAAEQNYAPAFLPLSLCFQNGIGVRADSVLAKHWAEKGVAAGQEIPSATAQILDRENYHEPIAKSVGLHILFGPIAFVWTFLIAFFGKRGLFGALKITAIMAVVCVTLFLTLGWYLSTTRANQRSATPEAQQAK